MRGWFGVALVAVACERRLPPSTEARRAQTSDASVSRDVSADRPDATDAEEPTSWTDPRMTAALARDCDAGAFGPEDYDQLEAPLSCFHGLAPQQCSFDPCSPGERSQCELDCGRSCASCQDRCRGACFACARGCSDLACRTRCATSCGACQAACLAEVDRCVTAGCTVRYRACKIANARAFRASGCAAACRRCLDLPEGNDMEQLTQCLRRSRRCSEEQRSTCFYQGPDYGSDVLDAGSARR